MRELSGVVTARYSLEDLERLQKYAEETGMSLSAAQRVLVAKALDAEEGRMRPNPDTHESAGYDDGYRRGKQALYERFRKLMHMLNEDEEDE